MGKKSRPKPVRQQKPDEEHIVKLKPVLGIHPGTYLTVLYGIILAVILFVVLFLPGIVKNGTVYTISSDPTGASLYVDGIFAGTTPYRIFIPSGKHTITLKKPFHSPAASDVVVEGRVFASLILPLKKDFTAFLPVQDPEEYIAWMYEDFSSWSLIEGFHPSYQPQPILSTGVNGLFSPGSHADPELIEGFLTSSMENVSDEALLKDVLYASTAFSSRGKVLTPGALISSAVRIIDIVNETPYLPFWLLQTLDQENMDIILQSPWFNTLLEQHMASLTAEVPPALPDGPGILINTVTFIPLEGGTLSASYNPDGALSRDDVISLLTSEHQLPRRVTVEGFAIARTEITKAQYKLFLRDVPEWRKENGESLTAKGLVTEQYLTNWESLEDDDPVSFISWYAASAFCSWLEKSVSSGYSVRLPTENEWEYAADTDIADGDYVFLKNGSPGFSSVYESGRNKYGIYGMPGNLWEWCDDGYRHASFLDLKHRKYGSDYFPSAERSVRGGSWANNEHDISIATRGSQPPSWCTGFLGFRPVLVPDPK